jgi:hypothetical protein
VKDDWDFLKGKIKIMFNQFHGTLCFLKVNYPFSLGDYKRISLFGCLFKLIAKMLSDGLAKVKNMVTTVTRSIFIKERNKVNRWCDGGK